MNVAGIAGGMGRPKRWSEDMRARFAAGTFDRIATVLREGEDRTEFVRAAVECELARREAGQGHPTKVSHGAKPVKEN